VEVLTPPALRLGNVSFSYGDNPVLKDISFSVPEGSFASVLGRSGCGKTTLLRIICGLLSPDSGEIWFGAKSASGLAPAERGVGIVFQDRVLFNNMTVLGNIEYVLRGKKGRGEGCRAAALAALAFVGLEGYGGQYPDKLSIGQQQRAALARTLALKPKILLLDEPLSSLDAELREQFRAELKAIQHKTGVTILYITHDQEEALIISDSVIIMHEGGIAQHATARQILSAPANQFVEEFVVKNIRAKHQALTKLVADNLT
jgi:ABC-type Fe3+/spermidine/putrescine transport system ATPase subunit